MGRIDKIQLGDTVYNLGVNAENIEGKVPVDLDDYYNKEETDGLLEDKQNKLTAGDNITIENNVISATVSGGSSEGVPTFTLYYEGETNWLLQNFNNNCKEYDFETGQVINTTIDSFIKKCYRYAIEKGKFCNMIIKTYDDILLGVDNDTEAIYTGVGYFFCGFNYKFLIELELDGTTHMPTERPVWFSNITKNDEKFQGKLIAGSNISIDENNVISASGGGEIDADEIPCYIAQIDETGIFGTNFLDNSKNGEQVTKTLSSKQSSAIASAISKAYKAGHKKMQLMLLFNNGSGILFDTQSGDLQKKPSTLIFTATGFTNAFTAVGVWKTGYVYLNLLTSFGASSMSLLYNSSVNYYYNNVTEIPNKTYVDNAIKNYVNSLDADNISY